MPPEDRALSPLTGWTRAHWEAVADHLLAAVEPWATDGFAQYRLPGRPSHSGPISDGLEGFARTFLIAAFRVAGAGGAAPGGILERYVAGLIAGTDPTHPYAWPPLTDMAQPLVEAASIAVALHETRPWLFDRLAPDDRARVVDWLAGFIGKRTPDNNWILFRVLVEQFLASVGGPHDPDEIREGLERIEPWYVGDGWYTDGAGQNFDYYAGWAMHLYPVLWARMVGGQNSVYTGRLREYLTGYQHFFAADGGPVFQGRSLTYRFAAAAPLWLGALVDATPLAPGLTRRLASGALRHFVTRGAPDERGLLSPGWHRPFLPMVQPYSGPASPYWAAKAFLGLLLPADHPVWTDVEQPAPIDVADTTVALPGPGWLLHGTRSDGVVRLVNHGSDRAARSSLSAPPDPNYVRFGYSTHTGPQFDPDSLTDPFDGHLAVVSPSGAVSARRYVSRIGVTDRFAVSAYEDGDVRIVTASVVGGGAEVRAHAVTAPPGHRVRDGGYALSAAEPPSSEFAEGSSRVRRPDGLTSGMAALAGFTAAGVHRTAGADAFARHAAIPFLTADPHPGGTQLYISLVTLGRTGSVLGERSAGRAESAAPAAAADDSAWLAGLDDTCAGSGGTRAGGDAVGLVEIEETSAGFGGTRADGNPVRLVGVDGTTVRLAWADGYTVVVGLGERPCYERRDSVGAFVARWPAGNKAETG